LTTISYSLYQCQRRPGADQRVASEAILSSQAALEPTLPRTQRLSINQANEINVAQRRKSFSAMFRDAITISGRNDVEARAVEPVY